MNIPDEAIEAAAAAIQCIGDKEVWEMQTPRVKDAARSDARAALDAAAPYLMAQLAEPASNMREAMRLAWEQGWDARAWGESHDNPYRGKGA